MAWTVIVTVQEEGPFSLVRINGPDAFHAVEEILPGSDHEVAGRGRLLVIYGGEQWLVKAYERRFREQVLLASYVSSLSSLFVREDLLGVSRECILVVGSRWLPDAAPFDGSVEGDGNQYAGSKFVGSCIRALRDAYAEKYVDREIVCMTKSLVAASSEMEVAGPLASYLRECKYFLECRRDVFEQHICIPLLAHGDLIPQNLICPNNSMRLVDFEYSHFGCVYSEVGKWFAQGGYLEKPTEHPITRMVEEINKHAEMNLDRAGIVASGLAWWADFRWLVSAVRRGRSDVLMYVASDLARLRDKGIADGISGLLD